MPDFNTLSPESLLVGILIGFLLTIFTVLLAAVVFDKPRKTPKVPATDPSPAPSTPYFDPKRTLDNASKLPKAVVTVGRGIAMVTVSKAKVPEHPANPVVVDNSPKPVQEGVAGVKGVNPFSPRFRYIGKKTYATFREALAAEFPEVLARWSDRRALEYTSMPREVREAIKREKIERTK